jgi:methyl-accepting chemotaxis protein
MLRQIQEQAELSSGSMKALAEQVGDATAPAERAVAMLDEIRALAAESDAQVQAIASAAREHVGTTGQMSRSLKTILDGMERSGREVPVAAGAVLTLAETAEKVFAVISQHRQGEADGQDGGQGDDNADRHATIRHAAMRAAARVAQTFEEAVRDGRISEADLFDRNYQPIPGTNPQKFTTRFDRFTDETLPAIQEPILEEHATVAYAGAVDDRGYFPTHNRRFSRPLTGNYDVDLANNRTKRIFSDRTGSRCGSNTQPFLLQTYKRDTGEVMHDVSVPIYVYGRHWGGFRIGYRSAAETGLGVAAATAPTDRPQAVAPAALPPRSRAA